MKRPQTSLSKESSKTEFIACYLSHLEEIIAQLDIDRIRCVIDAFLAAWEKGRTIYFIGNGGSAAIASHFANDIAIGTAASDSEPFKAVSLTDNVAIITALGNDEGYETIFERQLQLILQPGDVLVALSVSGRSENVLRAVSYARAHGALTVGCTGFDGGDLRKMVDVSFHVETPYGEYGPVEDAFQILDHLIYTYLVLQRRGRLQR